MYVILEDLSFHLVSLDLVSIRRHFLVSFVSFSGIFLHGPLQEIRPLYEVIVALIQDNRFCAVQD